MWRPFAIVLVCMGLASPGEAEQLRTASETLFCLKKDDLLMYAVARNTKEFKDREIGGCMTLRKGQRYTLLDRGEGSMVKVRVHMPRRGTVEGYAINPGD